MAAANIDNYLATESGRLTYDIYNRTVYSSPWIALPQKVAWTQQMGESYSNTMWERPWVDPNTEVAWTTVSLNNGSGNACIPPSDEVELTHTNRVMQLKHKAVYSPRFCVQDLMATGARAKQMDSVTKTLAEQVRLYWISHNRDEFTSWSTKYVVEPGLSSTDESSGATFPAVDSTSQLTNGVMEAIYERLILEQGHSHALSKTNGRPNFGLITDQRTSRSLMRADDAIREDWRKSSKSDSLLEPLGVTHTYNGYIHMIDDMPPRYTFSGGVWTEVHPYILDGNGKPQVNGAYLTAGYQDSYVWTTGSWRLRVPGAVTGVGAAEFNTQNYMGDFKFLNIVNDDDASTAYNPDGTIGRFRGVLMCASEGINPHVMITLRHKVCSDDYGLIDCA